MNKYYKSISLCLLTACTPEHSNHNNSPVIVDAANNSDSSIYDSGATTISDSSIDSQIYADVYNDAFNDGTDANTIHETLTVTHSTPVNPGVESAKCIDVPGPTVEKWVNGWHVKIKHLHHLNVWVRLAGTPNYAIHNCGDMSANQVLLSSSQPVLDQVLLNPKTAIKIPGGKTFILDLHLLNTTDEVALATNETVFDVVDAPEIELRAGYSDITTISVPPLTTKTISYYTNQFPAGSSIAVLTSHSHAHSESVVAKYNGAEIYRSTDWQAPVIKYFDNFSPDKLLVECVIVNDTANTITYGVKRDTHEMCSLNFYTAGGVYK